jgi:glucose-6-phosphate 1-dehydrogenase
MTARTIPVDTFDYLVFGGTGDLSLRKLLPALYLRDKAGQITGGSRIVGVSRTRMDPAAYRENAERALRQFLPAGEFDARTWERFSARLSYAAVDATSDDGWDSLARHLDGRDDVIRVFYLATSPSLFGPIAERLRAFDLVTPKSRVVLEKPIGHDLASAMHINEQVGGVFAEEQIYRIDH